MGKNRFNKDQLKFVEDRRGSSGWVKLILKYFVASLFLAVLYYIVFALLVSTEQERALERETALMEEEYWKMQQKIDVLDNTIKNLQQRDREIYKSIFDAEPPVYSSLGDDLLFEGMDTTMIESVVEDSKVRLSVIERGMGRVNGSIGRIYANIDALGEGVSSLPSIVPVKNFSISQSGASVGKKVNPFYKNVVQHTGMDLLAGTGTEVLSTADGVVEKVVRRDKKEGNCIVVNHKNGYVTKYKNLGDVLVRQGQKVKQGGVIGRIGMSGMSFAPHLHYEVWFNGEVMDPINYFFAGLTPQMFMEMLVIVLNTGQSLD